MGKECKSESSVNDRFKVKLQKECFIQFRFLWESCECCLRVSSKQPHNNFQSSEIDRWPISILCIYVFVYLYLCIRICVFINRCHNFQSFFDKLTSDQFRVHPMQCFHFRDVSPEDTHFMKTFVWSLSEGGVRSWTVWHQTKPISFSNICVMFAVELVFKIFSVSSLRKRGDFWHEKLRPRRTTVHFVKLCGIALYVE